MRLRRGAGLGGVVALLAAATLSLARAAAASEAGDATCFSRDLGGGTFFVRGALDVEFPPDVVFAVVSDYDDLARYVSAMDSSRVVRRDSTGVVVRQVGTAALLFRRTMRLVLRFEEKPPTSLRFEGVGGDFSVYYGSWEFGRQGGGTRMLYSVTMRPPVFVPQWIARPFAERVLCRTLSEVRAECARRRRVAPASGSK